MSKWPKLSATLNPPVDPLTCQKCGEWYRGGLPPSRWVECDDLDRESGIIVLLCRDCSDAIIMPHPRLYRRMGLFEVSPGSMPICRECVFRDGISCTHPDRIANGGAGLPIRVPKPTGVMFVDGPEGGWSELSYPLGAKVDCTGRKEAVEGG